MKIHSKSRGFTLIELLIVIAIIAVLTGIIITNLSGSRAKSRDAKRVSDIAQIQLAIEQYFDRCQQYPFSITNPTTSIYNGCPNGGSGSGQLNLSSFISQIPTDPSTGVLYQYTTYTPSGGVPSDYVLHAQLETKGDALNSSLKSGSATQIPSTPGWYTNNNCYIANANPPYDYCIGSR